MKPAANTGAPITGETVVALRALGFTDRDQLRFRFSFEESSLRRAVDLAAELRTMTRSTVQVRPGRWLLSRGRWTVALTTAPIPVTLIVIRLWEDEMRELANGRAGCRLIGWKPVMNGARALPNPVLS